jgi:hypothetical protein
MEETGRSERTLRRWIKGGRVPVTYVTVDGKREIRISEGAVRDLVRDTGCQGDVTVPSVAGQVAGQVTVTPEVMERLEQATYRIGWLEGQLDLTRKALTEGAEVSRQREEALKHDCQAREEALEKERQAVLELDRYLQAERQRRMAVEKEKAALEARVLELELPWWKKMFRPRMNALNL